MVKVLIVDDSSVARKSLREIMASLGHTVVAEAASGAQAFVEYTQRRPDVVTMDLTMQGMSGAEATSKIIATFPEARIIVVSAMEERKVVLDALERGARHFIIKPVTREKVASALNNVLQQKFDQQKHMELVRKLKGTNHSLFPIGAAAEAPLPPYRISQEDKLVLVKVNANITLTSYQSLCMELSEYLPGSPRLLLDFGTAASLDDSILIEIDKFVRNIEKNSGTVKAVSNNLGFVDLITQKENVPYLSAIIRHFPR